MILRKILVAEGKHIFTKSKSSEIFEYNVKVPVHI